MVDEPTPAPAVLALYDYKVCGGRWHEVEAEVTKFLNDGTGWILQAGVAFVYYDRGTNEAYIGQALYRKRLPQEVS